MNADCKKLGDFLSNDWEKFLSQDPVCVFTKGACHAFAIELHEFLSRSLDGGAVCLFSLKGRNPLGGDHVVVGVGNRFLDVTKTLMDADALSSWGVPERTSIEFLMKECDFNQSSVCFPDSPLEVEGNSDALRGFREKMQKTIISKEAPVDNRIGMNCCSSNGFGLRIDEPFFTRARGLARSCIETNGGEYLRLAREALGKT